MRSLTVAMFAAASAARVPGSFYPVPTKGLNSTSNLWTLDLSIASADDAFSVMTLQGIVSKTQASVFRYDPTSSAGLWLNETQALYGVRAQSANLTTLLSTYAPQLKGYVLVNLNDNSTNVGIAAAAAVNVVAVTTANQAAAVAAGLSMWMDVRGKDLAWALQAFNGTPATNGFIYSSSVTVLQDPSKTCCMGDFAIAAGALQWWRTDGSSKDPLSSRVWGSMGWAGSAAQGGARQPFAMFGWGPDELHTVDAVSASGGVVVGSDWASNLDVYSSFDIPSFTQRGTGKAPTPPQPVHTVAFMMTDGDNVQWLLQQFARGQDWFGSPDRGRVPMGWTLSPSLADLAPIIMNYLYREASDGSQPGLPGPDVFVGGVSGVGYFYPDSSPSQSSLLAVTNLTNGYLTKADMRLVNVMTYADGDISSQLQAYTTQPNIDGVIVYHYDDYSGLRGAISFSNGKPVVGGRCSLWGDGSGSDVHSHGTSSSACLYNVKQITDLLLSLPADPTSANGYSLIPVHAWSHNVTDALTIMQQLEAQAPGKYQVVTPDVLLQRVAANVKH